MANADFLELLFLRKHLVKYLRANLDPARHMHLPNSDEIAHDLAELLPRPTVVALDTGASTRTGVIRIALQAPNYADIPAENHDKIVAFLEECFREELFYFVKQQHVYAHLPLASSIQCFLGQYGITDEDISQDDLMRNWRRMAQRRGRPVPRAGRPMKPFDALKWPRTRDKLRRMMSAWPATKPVTKRNRVTRTAPRRKDVPSAPTAQLSFFPPS